MVREKSGLFCSSKYWTCSARCVIHTLRRHVLKPTAKSDLYVGQIMLCKPLGTLRKIFTRREGNIVA